MDEDTYDLVGEYVDAALDRGRVYPSAVAEQIMRDHPARFASLDGCAAAVRQRCEEMCRTSGDGDPLTDDEVLAGLVNGFSPQQPQPEPATMIAASTSSPPAGTEERR